MLSREANVLSEKLSSFGKKMIKNIEAYPYNLKAIYSNYVLRLNLRPILKILIF